jgi:hypothetical protein
VGNPMKTYLYCSLVLLLGAVASAGSLAEVDSPSEATKLAAETFQVLGITLGTSMVTDLGRVLGPAPFRVSADNEGTVSCYCSPGNARTLLEFRAWAGTIAEFRFSQGSPQTVNRCANSRLVSSSLATASGLRLGMSRRQIMALLGAPTRTRQDHFIYESIYDRPPTPEEVKHFNDAFYAPPALINVHERVDVRFRGGKAVRVDVLRAQDW